MKKSFIVGFLFLIITGGILQSKQLESNIHFGVRSTSEMVVGNGNVPLTIRDTAEPLKVMHIAEHGFYGTEKIQGNYVFSTDVIIRPVCVQVICFWAPKVIMPKTHTIRADWIIFNRQPTTTHEKLTVPKAIHFKMPTLIPVAVETVGFVEQNGYENGRDDNGNSGGDYGDGNDNRRCRGDNCRGSFSPGPFDRSPVDVHDNNVCISPDCSQHGGDDGASNRKSGH